jgi:hypothetical protein
MACQRRFFIMWMIFVNLILFILLIGIIKSTIPIQNDCSVYNNCTYYQNINQCLVEIPNIGSCKLNELCPATNATLCYIDHSLNNNCPVLSCGTHRKVGIISVLSILLAIVYFINVTSLIFWNKCINKTENDSIY